MEDKVHINATELLGDRPGIPPMAEMPEAEDIDPAALLRSYRDGEIDLVCVVGPTASGKTRYAVSLARKFNQLEAVGGSHGRAGAEILSADSRQVYRGMDIGTGKDLEEYAGIPYHLIDIADPGTQYNVHRFCEDFHLAVSGVRARGAFPILCGGTGLYISAVTGGYDFTGKTPLSAPKEGGAGVFYIGTLVSREERNRRIDARLRARLENGLVEEVKGLLDGSSPACRDCGPVPAEVLLSYGLEYKFVTRFILGELSCEELFDKLSTAIHQFAKRQMTWFRGMERSGILIHWVRV